MVTAHGLYHQSGVPGNGRTRQQIQFSPGSEGPCLPQVLPGLMTNPLAGVSDSLPPSSAWLLEGVSELEASPANPFPKALASSPWSVGRRPVSLSWHRPCPRHPRFLHSAFSLHVPGNSHLLRVPGLPCLHRSMLCTRCSLLLERHPLGLLSRRFLL